MRDYQNQYRKSHLAEFREYNKKSYKRNKEVARNSNLLRKFGISIDEYNAILEEQNDCCAICGRNKSEFPKALYVDHNHKTNKVRGLLCMNCNTGIGNLGDKSDILKKALDYLVKNENA